MAGISHCHSQLLNFSNILHTFVSYGFQQWEIGDSHDVDKSTTEHLFVWVYALFLFAYRMDALKSRSDTLRSLNHWKLLLHISFQLYIFAHRNKPRVRDKVLTDVKPKSEHLFVIGWMLCIFCPTGLVFCSGKPLRRSVLTIQKTQMWFISIFIHVCERLFDELVKELALGRFVIVSGSVREKNGKAVRFRKAHLRRRRRWCLSYRSRPVLFTSGLAKERYFRLRIPLCGLYCWTYIPAPQSLWLRTFTSPQISPLAPLGRNDRK